MKFLKNLRISFWSSIIIVWNPNKSGSKKDPKKVFFRLTIFFSGTNFLLFKIYLGFLEKKIVWKTFRTLQFFFLCFSILRILRSDYESIPGKSDKMISYTSYNNCCEQPRTLNVTNILVNWADRPKKLWGILGYFRI